MSSLNDIPLPSKKRSELAQRLLYLDGDPFRLVDYPFYPAIYDGHYQGLLLKCGRQVGKSVSLCNFTISESIGIPHFKTLFIAPSQEQTQRFSNTRLAKVVHYSPLVRRHFISHEFSDRTMLRMFRNGSEVALTYACDDPDRARGVSADRNCFDKDAQALTRNGWIHVRDLQETDLVADVDDFGVVRWAPPENLFTKKHTGKMVTFKRCGLYLRVTGDHNLWVNFRVKASAAYHQPDRYEFVKAIDLAETPRMGFKTTCKAEWCTENEATHWRLADQHYHTGDASLNLPVQEFAELLGWYLAEGHCAWRDYGNDQRTCPRPTITQNAGIWLTRIQALATACGIPHRVNNSGNGNCRTVTLVSNALGYWFANLGLSHDKHIPRLLFDYPHALYALLRGLYLRDACHHENEKWHNATLRTRSRRLAEDVQEAWLRVGRPAAIHTRMHTGGFGIGPSPLYEVCAYNRDYQIFWRAEFETKQRVTVEDVVDEDVWCFTVPNHRPIVKGNFESIPIITSQCFDEIQDILYDPVVPVINECLGNSDYGYETYAGTPKTLENTIEYLWSISSRTEWIMKCEGCGSWSFIESAKAIGKTGPLCVKCGHLLNPRAGMWYDFNPGTRDKPVTLKGFHISQPMLPRNMEKPERWQRILDKLERYSDTKFKNEVLGISDALGARIIGKDELEALCRDYDVYRTPPAGLLQKMKGIVAGVDWSGGGTEGVSRTVLWIWGITPEDRLRTLYHRIYPTTSPVAIVDDVVEVLQAYSVKLVIGDRGEGHLANDLIAKRLGKHRVHQLHYGSQATPLSWNDKGQFYTGDRTSLMDNYFMVLKRQGVEYPRLEYMREAITDVLNIYEEVTTQGRKVWRHAKTQPDDAFHAQLFGWLAAKIIMMDLQFSG
jgi:hypothetical protein